MDDAALVQPDGPRFRVVLASQSPSRRRLLAMAGIDADVEPSGVDEDAVTERLLDAHGTLEAPDLAAALALAKCESVASARVWGAGTVLVAADSMLEWDGRAYGKPGVAHVAAGRLRGLSGHTATLHTGHCLAMPARGRWWSGTVGTQVRFADLLPDEIDAYVATGEPLQVAGSFTLEGLGAPLVAAVYGDPSNVVGLSLPLLRRVLLGWGVAWPDLARWSRR